MPFFRLAHRQTRKEAFGGLDTEIMIQRVRRPVINQRALIKDENAVVQPKVARAVGDIQDDSITATRELMHQLHNFVFGFRVEPAGHLIAEQEVR